MKKKRFAFLILVLIATIPCFAELSGKIVDISPYRDTYLITLDNGLIWQFERDQGKTRYKSVRTGSLKNGASYTSVPYYVPGRDNQNIAFFLPGDAIVFNSFETNKPGNIAVFSDSSGQHQIGCSLVYIEPETFPVIQDIDSDGYTVILSNRMIYNFSWWQSWASYHWEIGDTLISINNGKTILNLSRFKSGKGSYQADKSWQY